MAGSGVSGGTAMLRTRRRDVSIKPNRRLDRKSSRGMIYENEELRLRTININAEVEQGQNDIKKLRRENEQLRREIWSLRDEYDKLEELVKNQSSHGSSDEFGGRSGEEENVDDVYTEYSGDDDVVDEDEEELEEEEDEEDEEDEDEEEEDDEKTGDVKSQEEDLENVENQKISSEKMNSSQHRLHVEFDDLSIVDEEEELQKKDKEKKDSNSTGASSGFELKNHHADSNERNYPYFTTIAEQKYFNDSPFVFPNPSDPNYPKMIPVDNSNIYEDRLTPVPSLDTPGIGEIDPIFGNNEFEHIPTPLNFRDNFHPILPNLPKRRNIAFKQSVNLNNDNSCKNNNSTNQDTPNSCEAVNQNGWDFSRALKRNDEVDKLNSPSVLTDKRKHFFAPLPSKFRPQKSVDEILTATSSSSDKTSSTIVSRNNYLIGKGTADVYVNGAFPINDYNYSCVDNKCAFLSSDNLTVEEVMENVSRHGSNNHLIKSLSCQDLSSDPQTLPFSEKLKLFNTVCNSSITKSDNTLDNITSNCTSSRPFKSQLNVTLKLRKQKIPSSPDTPEIPKLPVINYRFFNNPFLQNYNAENREEKFTNFNFDNCPTITRPLSIQVNEDPRTTSTINNKNLNFKSTIEDPCLLLMAANQYRNLEERNYNSQRRNIGFEMTSFEGPSPQTLLPIPVNPILQNQMSYNNNNNNNNNNSVNNNNNAQIIFPANLNTVNKVPAQTQTSIDDGGDFELESIADKVTIKDKKNQCKDNQGPSVPSSPLTLRRKRTLRKERSGSIKETNNKRPLSPAAQRRKERLRKQNSVTSSVGGGGGGGGDQQQSGDSSPNKISTPQLRSRKLSVTTSTSNGEIHEKNESRSSSSGQDSPKKIEQRRRVSLYFNAKKRPSIISTSKVDNNRRRSSGDNVSNKDRRYSSVVRNDPQDVATTTNSERERTNSVSSRDTVTKGRKMSTGSGKVPWCACWGNGCV